MGNQNSFKRLPAALFLFVAIAVFPGCRITHAPATPTPDRIVYRIFMEADSPQTLTMELTLPNPGGTREMDLHLPSVYGPAGITIPKEKLFTHFEIDPQVKDGSWIHTTDILRRVRFDTADDPVVIRYRVKQGYEGAPFDRQLVFSPAIQKEYWYLSSSTSLLVPDIKGPVNVTMKWYAPGGAKNWKLLTSYGAVETRGASRCEQSFVTTMNEFFLRNPKTGAGEPSFAFIFMFGDFQVFQKTISGGKCDLNIALTGLPDYVRDSRQLFEAACANIERQGSFWGDSGYSYYFVNFVTHPNRDNDRFGGYNLTRTFTSFIPQSPRPSPTGVPTGTFENLVAHLSHEYVHTWLRPDMIDPQDMMRLYCMVEGGAEYFGEYFLLTEEVVDFRTHVKRYNRFLREYSNYGEEVQTADIKQIEKEFWANFPYQRQPYLRGFLLLHNWHARIRRESEGGKGVNDFMLQLVKTGWKNPVSVDQFQSVSLAFLKEGAAPDLLASWVKGGIIEPDPEVFGPWCELKKDDSGVPFFAVNKALIAEKGEPAAIAWFD